MEFRLASTKRLMVDWRPSSKSFFTLLGRLFDSPFFTLSTYVQRYQNTQALHRDRRLPDEHARQ